MSIAGLAPGKRVVSASGKATTSRSTTSAHGLPSRVVLEWLAHPVALEPAADHLHVRPGRVRRLGDERELRVERQRDVMDQAAQELVANRARGSLGNGAEQVPAAEPRAGTVDVDVGRHEPVPPDDASARYARASTCFTSAM